MNEYEFEYMLEQALVLKDRDFEVYHASVQEAFKSLEAKIKTLSAELEEAQLELRRLKGTASGAY